MSETLRGGEASSPVGLFCPHCREPLDPAACVCPHCRRDVTLDLLLAEPVPNPRQRYELSRALVALSPKPLLGDWLHRLERGGVILAGVTAERAESVMSVLRAAGLVPVTNVHQQSIARKMVRGRLGAALALGLAVVLVFAVIAARWLLGRASLTPREVAARALPSVAVLRCGTKMGSGFFVTEHMLLTNEHVTCDSGGELDLELADGTKGKAQLVSKNERLDLAVVETTLKGPPLKFASAGELASGDTVMIAGAPMGLERTFHVGSVSNARRVLIDVCYLQVDARINPGNSGGPLLDAHGRAVGVVSLIERRAEGIGFAIPIDYAFQGESPLMPLPSWYPTRGFTAMLADAEHESEQLIEEAKRLPVRVVRGSWAGTNQIVAELMTVGGHEPKRTLDFRLEHEGQTICRVSAPAKWRQGSPRGDLGKRTNEWMNRTGVGNVYSGIVELDLHFCKFRKDPPIDLILREGDEKVNRTTL